MKFDDSALDEGTPRRRACPQRGEDLVSARALFLHPASKSKFINLIIDHYGYSQRRHHRFRMCRTHRRPLFSARANLKPLVIEGHEPGGQLSLTTLVENFPGFPEGVQGPELIENMRKQASRFGAEYRTGHVVKADLSKRPFTLTMGKETIHTKTLIIASGASARWLGLPNEQALIGHGVSSCATCDGFFFSGKEIVVIGGGDSAMEEATFLTRFASQGHADPSS